MNGPDDVVRRQARALGDPTRHRIFRLVAGGTDPVTVAELTAELGLHHNAVRQHLAKLRDAGLVVEESEERSRPGRPRLLYRVAVEAGTWGGDDPYERLALLLAEAVRSGSSPREVGRRAGRRQVRPDGDGDPVTRLEREVARQGFRPRRAAGPEGLELVLERCPYAAVAAADPRTVCQLHLGLTEGLAEGLDGVEVRGLVPRDPHTAGCRLQLGGEATT